MNNDKFIGDHFVFATMGLTPKQIIKQNMPENLELGRYKFDLIKTYTTAKLVKIFKEVLSDLGFNVTFNVTNNSYDGLVYLRIIKIN